MAIWARMAVASAITLTAVATNCLADLFTRSEVNSNVSGIISIDTEYNFGPPSNTAACAGAICASGPVSGSDFYANTDGTHSVFSGSTQGYSSLGHTGAYASFSSTNIEPTNQFFLYSVGDTSYWTDAWTNQSGGLLRLDLTGALSGTVSMSSTSPPTLFSGGIHGGASVQFQGTTIATCNLSSSGTCDAVFTLTPGESVVVSGETQASFSYGCVTISCLGFGSDVASFSATASALNSFDLVGVSATDINGNVVSLSKIATGSGDQLTPTGYAAQGPAVVPEPSSLLLFGSVLVLLVVQLKRNHSKQQRA